MSEWFKEPLSKSGISKGIAGSNPALSARDDALHPKNDSLIDDPLRILQLEVTETFGMTTPVWHGRHATSSLLMEESHSGLVGATGNRVSE
jgi:hypothetical protein